MSKTYNQFITEASSHMNEGQDKFNKELVDASWKVTKAGAKLAGKLAWKAAKAGAKAAYQHAKNQPKGTKRRTVADTLHSLRTATLSDEERTRRRRERVKNQRRVDREVNRARKEREREQKPTQDRGRYRGAGAGTVERI